MSENEQSILSGARARLASRKESEETTDSVTRHERRRIFETERDIEPILREQRERFLKTVVPARLLQLIEEVFQEIETKEKVSLERHANHGTDYQKKGRDVPSWLDNDGLYELYSQGRLDKAPLSLSIGIGKGKYTPAGDNHNSYRFEFEILRLEVDDNLESGEYCLHWECGEVGYQKRGVLPLSSLSVEKFAEQLSLLIDERKYAWPHSGGVDDVWTGGPG